MENHASRASALSAVSRPPAGIEAELFGVLADHAQEGLFAIALPERRVVAVNRAVVDLTGRTREQLLAIDADALFAPDSVPLDAILARPGLHEDVALSCADGYPLFVTITWTAVVHRAYPELVVCIARDTTERRLLEREVLSKHTALYAAHVELERAAEDLAERNRELSVLGAQLSQAARRALIGELSAGIAHSFNNPLGAIASTHRQMLTLFESLSTSPAALETMQRLAKRSETAIGRMERIVQSIRHAHQSGAATPRPRHTDVAQEIEVALQLFDSRLRGLRVTRAFEGETRGFLSPGDLQHVLWNLLDNAILAMPDGGELRIEARADARMVTVAVEDSGVGLAPTLLPTLFQPFNSTRPSGSGLGLSTARRLARAWGGDVNLAPTASGRGARFEIQIPREEAVCSGVES